VDVIIEGEKKDGMIAVLCAGTSDISVADEAQATAEFLGSSVESVYDVGVAGLHRIVNANTNGINGTRYGKFLSCRMIIEVICIL